MSAPLRVKLFADGADLASMLELHRNPAIQGFTTNPTLMRKAGIADYEAFARDVLAVIRDRPISFEVFSDEWPEMARQAERIASWGENVWKNAFSWSRVICRTEATVPSGGSPKGWLP